MNFRYAPLILLFLSVGALVYAQAPPPAGQAGGRGPRYVDPTPLNFNDHAGWQSMFDGSTLKGWDGPMDIWRVESGAIVTSATAENSPGPVFLYWAGSQLKNFEFKTELKLEGEGANSGVQFRAQRLGPSTGKYSQWESRGYQADFDYINTQTGALIECCAGPRRGVPPRPDKASMGYVVRAALGEGQKPSVVGTLGDPEELKKLVHVGDWNELHLIARGTTMMYFLNGRLMSVYLDDNPTMFVERGELAIQLEGRGNTKVSFRNLSLKILP